MIYSEIIFVIFCVIQLQTDDVKHNQYLNQAVKYTEQFKDDVTIISGEMDEIKTNKYLLLLCSPNLIPLLSTPCCISPTLLLPDCSTFSLQHLVNIITTGYTVTEGMSSKEMNEITEAGQLLSVELKNLQHGRTKGCLLYTSPSPRD